MVWFHSYTDKFIHTRFDTAAVAGNQIQLTLTLAALNWNLEALSGDFSCAAIYSLNADGSTGPAELSLFTFSGSTAVVPPVATLKMVATVLVAAGDVTAAATANTILVANACDAVKIGSSVYFMNAGRTNMTVGAALPAALANPVYSSDFKVIISDDGIYTLDSATNTYTRKLAAAFFANKKVWSIGT